jgi:hypothetical protein
MRQVGTMTEGELLEQDSRQEIEQSGELVIVRRKLSDGTESFFTIFAKSQPLTPTFVHDIEIEDGENVQENDQRDFVCVGKTAVMKDVDHISWGGYLWHVSTSSELMSNGKTVTTHCLCLKDGKATF